MIKTTITMLIIISLFYVLKKYVLPKMGISTWLSKSCQVDTEEVNLGRSNELEKYICKVCNHYDCICKPEKK